jgi:predicted MFS family arabinose efflux permease
MSDAPLNKTTFWQFWSPTFSGFLLYATSIGLFGIYGVFVNIVAAEFNASVAALGFGMALTSLVIGGTGPIIGPLLDRYPIKKIMLIGVIVTLGSFVALANGTSLLALALALCFVTLGIALYGQMPTNVMLVNNYSAHRGRALSVAASGTSFGGIVLPPLAALLISSFGWRQGLVVLATVCSVIALYAILIGLKHYKKLEPETILSAKADNDTENNDQKPTPFRSKAFWLIGICFGLSYGAGTVYSFALVPHAQNLGYDIKAAALILSVGGSFGFIGKIAYAIYAERLKEKLILTTLCLLTVQLLVWLIIIHTDNLFLLYLSAAGLGLCAGAFLPLYPVFISTYFEESIMGKVSGNQALIFIPFLFMSAPLAGVSFDQTGSYIPMFWAVTGVTLVTMSLFVILGQPAKQAH